MQSGCYIESTRIQYVDGDREGGLGGRYEGSASTTFGGNEFSSERFQTILIVLDLLATALINRIPPSPSRSSG
jgi:hypothetical protein